MAGRKRISGELSAELIRLFMAEHLRFTGGRWAGKPFVLEPWQYKHMIKPLFGTLDARGKRVYREALFGLPRWGGKSQVAAGLALAVMFTEPVYEGEYYVVATTRQQAGIVFDKAKRMVLSDPQLRAATHVYRNLIEVEETGAIFRVLPWDADTAQGFHPTCCIIDEYHVHRNASMREAMLSGMVGSDNGLLITISTAGPERKGPLWDLLRTAPKDPRAYVYWCGAGDDEDGHDPKAWRRANPSKWITMKMLRDQYRTLPFPVFERLHLNRFPSSGTNRAYPADLWHACSAPPDFDPERPTMLGLDASWTRDTTALVMVQRSDAGRHSVWSQVWRKDAAMGHIDHEAVEAKIVELCAAYNVVRIACDPNYFTRSMLKLEHEFHLPIEEFPQDAKRMSAASMALYDVILEGRIAHGGDAELTDQVLNAGVKATPYGWRITRIEEERKVDAAVALAMAVYLAEAEGATFAPSFAETGGIWTLKLDG
jgi:phage terminase large subunit-like protein